MRAKVLKPIVIFLLIILLIVGALFVFVQSSVFKHFVKITTNSIVSGLTNQEFIIGSIEGDLLRGVTLYDVKFVVEDRNFIECDEVFIDYSLPLLLDSSMIFSKVIPVDGVNLSGLKINIIRYEDGTWNFEKFRTQEDKDDEKKHPDWNLFIKNSHANNVKVTIIDLLKNETSEFRTHNLDLSIKMFNIAEKIEFYLQNGDLSVLWNIEESGEPIIFSQISARAVYDGKRSIKSLNLQQVNFNYEDLQFSVVGRIEDFDVLKFHLNADVEDVISNDYMQVNLHVNSKGVFKNVDELRAKGRVELKDSLILGKEIRGKIVDVDVKGPDLLLKKGTLNAEFGEASFDGSISLLELFKGDENNNFDLDVSIESISTSKLMALFRDTETIKEAGVNEVEARANGNVNIKGFWIETEDLKTTFDINNLTIAGEGIGEIDLKGPLSVDKSGIEFEVQSNFSEADFSTIFNDSGLVSKVNSNLIFNGQYQFDKDFYDGFQGGIKGEFQPSVFNSVNFNRIYVDSSYSQSLLNIKSLIIESEVMQVNASGDLGERGIRGINYDIDLRDLQAISTLFKKEDLKGSLKLNGRISGNLLAPKLTYAAEGTEFIYKEKGLEAQKLNLKGDFIFDLENLNLNADGNLKGVEFHNRKFQTLDFKANTVGEEIVGNLNILESITRKYSMDFRLTDYLKSEKHLFVNNLILNITEVTLKNRQPIEVTIYEDKINMPAFNLYHKENYIAGEGDVYFDDRIDISIQLKQISLLDISELLNIGVPVKGLVSGDITIGTSLEYPNINANLVSKNIEYMNFQSDEMKLHLLFTKNELNFDLIAIDDSKEVLSAKGNAGFDLSLPSIEEIIHNATYQADIKSNGVDISPIATINESLKSLEGKLMIDVTASGSGASPNVIGTAEVNDVKFEVITLKNGIEIKNAVMDLKGDYGLLRPVLINSGGGEGVFEGRVNLHDLSYTGKGELSGMFFSADPDDVTADIDGEIDVRGKIFHALITGDLTARNIQAVVPEKPVKVIENIAFIEDKGVTVEEFIFTGEQEIGYFEEFIAMDINVDIPQDSWVKGSGVNVEVEGRLGITKEYGEPYIVAGNIDVVRGDYQFMGKLFNIEGGTVSFRGKEVIDPFIDIRALYEVSSVDVFINVTGTSENPKIQLSSDPPLDENEIVSYLVFGTSSDKLGTDERVSFQEKAGEFLGTMAVDELRDMFGDQFALDIITIKGGQTGFRDTHFEVGKYLTEDLYVGYERYSYERFFYERYFFSPGLPSSIVTANRAVIEYRLFDFLTLESEIGEVQGGADLFFNFDY